MYVAKDVFSWCSGNDLHASYSALVFVRESIVRHGIMFRVFIMFHSIRGDRG